MISAGCIRAATSRYEGLKTPAARKPPSVGNGSHAPRLRFFGCCGLNTAVSEPVWTIIQIVPLQKGLNLTRHAALCAASQCSDQLEFRGLFDRDVAGVRAVENLVYVKAARRHVSGKFTPYSLSPPLAGNSRAPVAASEPFSADAAIGFHPSEFALHRLRPTQPAARHGWRAPASGSRRLQGHAATPPSVAM